MIIFKIRISQLTVKILLKQQSLNQIRHCFTGQNQIWYFMAKVNQNNGNETKSNIFPWDIFKSDTIFLSKHIKYFINFQNQNFSFLWLTWTKTMGVKQNQTFFHGTYSDLMLLFTGRKILKYVNGFCNWHFSIWLQKWTQSSKVK